MLRYEGASDNSGVVAYQPGADFIQLKFRDGRRYIYSYRCPGPKDVEAMKGLATAGKGLTTYVNKYVRDRFDTRLS